ncbi:MAG: hypothetical protein HQK78_17765 [Desulfobacterales bacterium]|nr:hypothetical protein [Desulfobacterales bacterium]
MNLNLTPTHYKNYFQSKGIPIAHVSAHLKKSYCLVNLAINGRTPLSSKMKLQLDELIHQIEEDKKV